MIASAREHFLRPGTPESELEFALLCAAPFSYQVTTRKVQTPFPALIAQLLRAPANTAPILSGEITHLFNETIAVRRADAIRDLTWDGARYKLTYGLEAFDGQTLWIEETGERVSGNGSKPGLVQGVIRDITDQSRSRSEILRDAQFDRLTGLLSPAAMLKAIRHENAFTGESDYPSYLLALSLDNLADINRLYGHAAGDECLNRVAQALEMLTPDPNIRGRLSGSQFGVLIPHHVWVETQGKRIDIEAQIFNRPFGSSHGTLLLGGTIDAVPAGSDAMARLLDRLSPEDSTARAAMPASKGGAPDTFSPSDIKTILAEDRISLAYQPIVDAVSGETVHHECLMRLIISGGEQISAWKLILDAEKHGLVHLLDRRALEIAEAALGLYPKAHLALNVSAGTVKDDRASAEYLGRLMLLGAKARRLSLELTETLALGSSQEANSFAARARAMGCRFAIDDFGAGHTSFANLMSIEADIIKIDGAFIRDIARQKHKQTFVRLIVDLARTLGVKTVAEMVDNAADAKLLRHLDVDYLQGYYFGYPGALSQDSSA